MRHRRSAALTALIGGLVLASTALAGGWAQITLKGTPVDPPAGTGVPIEFDVMQHGVTPVSWPRITVIATNATTGDVVRSASTAQGPTGHYVSTITFPTQGAWTITFDSLDLLMEGSATMSVSVAAAAAPATGATVAASSALAPLALTGLAALIVAVAAGWVLRARRGGRPDERATLSS